MGKQRAWQETWFWEQAVLVVLLAVAGIWQLVLQRGGDLPKAAAMTLLTSALTFAGQKVRSMADRQAERNAAAGSEAKNAPMSCAGRVRRWAVISQGLSVVASAVGAPTPAHVAVAAYVFAYPYWRRWYRRRWPHGRAAGRVSVAGLAPVSPRRLVPMPVHVVPTQHELAVAGHGAAERKLPDVGSYVDDKGRTVRWWHTRAMRVEDCTYCADGCCEQRVESCEAWKADVVVHDRPRVMHA